jgi:hypothetical protein
MIYIGIDPGVNTGFAIWDSKAKQIIEIKTMDFWSVINRIDELKAEYGVSGIHVIIEDPNPNKPIFLKAGIKSKSAYGKVGQNIGSNKREASLLIEYMALKEIPHTSVVPKGSRSKSKGKVTPAYFSMISGYKGRTSQHCRDAGMLVVGK